MRAKAGDVGRADPGRLAAGDVVRLVRRRAGYSIAELAGRSGVSVTSIRSIEVGGTQPTVRTLSRLVAGAGGQLRLGVEWPGEPVRLLTDYDQGELRRWAAGAARRHSRPTGCSPERVLAYIRERPGATAAQVAYAFGIDETRVRRIARALIAGGRLDGPMFDQSGPAPSVTESGPAESA